MGMGGKGGSPKTKTPRPPPYAPKKPRLMPSESTQPKCATGANMTQGPSCAGPSCSGFCRLRCKGFIKADTEEEPDWDPRDSICTYFYVYFSFRGSIYTYFCVCFVKIC